DATTNPYSAQACSWAGVCTRASAAVKGGTLPWTLQPVPDRQEKAESQPDDDRQGHAHAHKIGKLVATGAHDQQVALVTDRRGVTHVGGKYRCHHKGFGRHAEPLRHADGDGYTD